MKNNDDIKKLLEAFDRTEQWRGKDPNTPNGKLVGESDKFLGEPHIREDDAELYHGCYVRDEQEGQRGEIFKMNGDPEDRRVRIEDEQGRGWYIHPGRLVKVDDNDPEISEYFNGRDKYDEDAAVPGAEQNKEMAHAKIALIQGREGEQRRVWQQHYDRAIRNGRDKMRARQYADSMTGSESAFGESEEQVNEREVGVGYDAAQRGTPPWMMPGMGGNDDDNGNKKTSFQLAGDDEDDNVFVDEEIVDEYGADVANDMATPDVQPQVAQQQQPKTYGDVRGKLSPAARNMFAQRQLAKLSQQDQENNPFESVDSSKYATTEELAEALTKAYEDYVGDPYSENNIIPKANKRPGKDVPKPKKAKRQPEPNELAEMFPNRDSGSTDAENRAWERRFKKVQAAKKKAQAAKAKKEKPFRDAAATGNPRDFANESNADDERDERRDARVPADEPEYKWDGVNRPAAAMHNGRSPEKKKEKPVAEAKGKSSFKDEAKKLNQFLKGKGYKVQKFSEDGYNGFEWIGKDKTIIQATDSRDGLANWAVGSIRKNGKKDFGTSGNDPIEYFADSVIGEYNDYFRDEMDEGAKGKKKSENRELWDRIKARGTVPSIDKERYTDMSGEGLEGPFRQKNGQVLYYDPKAGKYYNRNTDMYVDNSDYDAMNEGDPDIPLADHLRNKEKDRQAFAKQFRRDDEARQRKKTDDNVLSLMQKGKNGGQATAVGESGRGARLATLRAKFESISGKLKELKGQKALKEAPIDQTVAPVVPGQQPQQQQGAAPATTVAPTPGAAANPATAGATQPAVPAKPTTPGTPVSAQAAVPNMVAGIKQSMQPAAFNSFKQTVAKA